MNHLTTQDTQALENAAAQRFTDMDPTIAKAAALAVVKKLMAMVGAKVDNSMQQTILETADFIAEHIGRNWCPEQIIDAHRKAAAGELRDVKLYAHVTANTIGQVMKAYMDHQQEQQRLNQGKQMGQPKSYMSGEELETRNREAFELAYERAEEEFNRTGKLTEQFAYFYITDYMLENDMLDGQSIDSCMASAEQRLKSGERSSFKGHKAFKALMSEMAQGKSGVQKSLAKTIMLERHFTRKQMRL